MKKILIIAAALAALNTAAPAVAGQGVMTHAEAVALTPNAYKARYLAGVCGSNCTADQARAADMGWNEFRHLRHVGYEYSFYQSHVWMCTFAEEPGATAPTAACLAASNEMRNMVIREGCSAAWMYAPGYRPWQPCAPLTPWQLELALETIGAE